MLCGDMGGNGAKDDGVWIKLGVANINNATINICEFKSNHIQYYYYGAKLFTV